MIRFSKNNYEKEKNQRGVALLDMIVGLGMSSILLTALAIEYANMSRMYYDGLVKDTTTSQAQAIIQTMISELRILGNGVPFDQTNFQINETTLSDISKADPINITNSSNSRLDFRLNEEGAIYVVTAAFDPSSSLNLYLDNVDGLAVGEEIYLSNSTVAEEDGLWGQITAVNTGSSYVTLANTFVNSPSSTFGIGSICEQVAEISYNNTVNGITRSDGTSTITLASGSAFTMTYFNDVLSTSYTPPLLRDDIINNIRTLRITVSATSQKRLTSGSYYTASVTQTVGLRNLNLVY